MSEIGRMIVFRAKEQVGILMATSECVFMDLDIKMITLLWCRYTGEWNNGRINGRGKKAFLKIWT